MMWRAREDKADRNCGPLFFTLWNSDVLPGDYLGRGEMDWYKMEKKNGEKDRFDFRVDDSGILSCWDENVSFDLITPYSSSIFFYHTPVCDF